MNLGHPPFMCSTRLLCPEVSPAMKCNHSFATHTPSHHLSPKTSFFMNFNNFDWSLMKDSCVHPLISSQLSVFLLFLFHIQDWGYNPTPCKLSHHCDSLCSRMMVYKWMVHMKVTQIHQYLFCHKSRPVLGEMHLDHHHSPKWSSMYFIKSWC